MKRYGDNAIVKHYVRGSLTVILFILNRLDTSRVHFASCELRQLDSRERTGTCAGTLSC